MWFLSCSLSLSLWCILRHRHYVKKRNLTVYSKGTFCGVFCALTCACESLKLGMLEGTRVQICGLFLRGYLLLGSSFLESHTHGGLQALIAVSWAYGKTSLSAVRAFLRIGIWGGLSGKINKSGIVIYFVGLVPLNNKSPRALYNWLFLNAFKQRSSLFCQFLQLPWGVLASLLWDSPSWPISENFNVYFNGWLL